MYFPCEEFLTFLKELDAFLLENANQKSLERYGARLVEVATQQVRANQQLEDSFKKLLVSRLESLQENTEVYNIELTSVYAEISRKLCNTRLREFLSAHQQVAAAKKGIATLSDKTYATTSSHNT